MSSARARARSAVISSGAPDRYLSTSFHSRRGASSGDRCSTSVNSAFRRTASTARSSDGCIQPDACAKRSSKCGPAEFLRSISFIPFHWMRGIAPLVGKIPAAKRRAYPLPESSLFLTGHRHWYHHPSRQNLHFAAKVSAKNRYLSADEGQKWIKSILKGAKSRPRQNFLSTVCLFAPKFAKVSIFLLIFDNQDAMMVNDIECFQRNWM